MRGIDCHTRITLRSARSPPIPQVRRHEALAREFPLLCRAAAETGSIATQNRGTLGGNIANASPAADSPPALLVYDAELELVSASGDRAACPFTVSHGYKQMALRPDELIASIRLPRKKRGWRQYYRKVGTRRAQAISKVCFAGAARMENGGIADVRIALGSVAPTVLRATGTEDTFARRSPHAELIRAAQETLAQRNRRRSTIFAPRPATAFAWRRICSPNFCESLVGVECPMATVLRLPGSQLTHPISSFAAGASSLHRASAQLRFTFAAA